VEELLQPRPVPKRLQKQQPTRVLLPLHPRRPKQHPPKRAKKEEAKGLNKRQLNNLNKLNTALTEFKKQATVMQRAVKSLLK
jgi:hypothetical protein